MEEALLHHQRVKPASLGPARFTRPATGTASLDIVALLGDARKRSPIIKRAPSSSSARATPPNGHPLPLAIRRHVHVLRAPPLEFAHRGRFRFQLSLGTGSGGGSYGDGGSQEMEDRTASPTTARPASHGLPLAPPRRRRCSGSPPFLRLPWSRPLVTPPGHAPWSHPPWYLSRRSGEPPGVPDTETAASPRRRD